LDDESKSHLVYDSISPLLRRSRGHVASFAASIAAHAAIVALIVCFASPLARGHNEWVLAYLVEGADGSAGRGGDAAASRAAPNRAASVALAALPTAPRSAPPKAARKLPRREDAHIAVASVSPERPVALARPDAAARDARPPAPDAAPHSGAADAGPAAAGIGSGASRGGTGSLGAADGGAGDDPNSIAHADYARNPPPVYPADARRRAEQGTVTIRVLIGADGSVEHAELAESSGFDSLDDAALDTVRSRWRFVPARHGGLAVESWVLVPIRFALLEANAAVR